MSVRLSAALRLALFVPALYLADAGAATFGSLSNFDVINDTGQPCHGFEIELEGVSSKNITYTFGGSYIRYGTPKVVDKLDASGNVTGVYVRYMSPYDTATGQFTEATSPAPTVTTTNGHACWVGGMGAGYATSGCEHFGVGISGTPTATQYRWLVADSANPGSLVPLGTEVTIPAPVWSVAPPPNPVVNPNPVVRAVLPAAPPRPVPRPQYGTAKWVKTFVAESPSPVLLESLLSGNPLVPQNAAQVEMEWKILQEPPAGVVGANEEEVNEKQPGAGSEAVVRRYEFYEYTGQYDPQSHEVMCDNSRGFAYGQLLDGGCNAPGPGELGNYLGSQMVALNVVKPLTLRKVATLPPGEINVPYANQSILKGGILPYTVTVASGILPPGMAVNPDTGQLEGIPTAAGLYSFSLSLSDSNNPPDSRSSMTYNLRVATPVTVKTASLPAGTPGTAYSATLAAVNGVAPYKWSRFSGSLPAGLTFANGVISGTPTKAGTFSVTFKVTDKYGVSAKKLFKLVIQAPLGIATASLPAGKVNTAYTTQLTASGGAAPFSWSLTGGTLPAGLALTGASGAIAGTPTAAGTSSLTFTVTDSKGASASKSLNLTVNGTGTVAAGTNVDIAGTIDAIDLAGSFLTIGGVNVYWNGATTIGLNTNAGKITTVGALPPGTAVGLAIQGKGVADANGKVTAIALEIL